MSLRPNRVRQHQLNSLRTELFKDVLVEGFAPTPLLRRRESASTHARYWAPVAALPRAQEGKRPIGERHRASANNQSAMGLM